MNSVGGLWEGITSRANLLTAWEQFRSVHVDGFGTVKWMAHLDERLSALREELLSGTYRPGRYSCFRVCEPKPRTISRAPVRDRIVHHALCNYITPVFERRFIGQSYSCRVGLGTHRACARARELARRGGYFLKMDVRHYFDSIDWDIMERVALPMFREREIRDLLTMIIENRQGLAPVAPGFERKGMPIGNLTSQWLANLYLDGLDHYVAETLRAGSGYLRYTDDMVVFLPTKEECHSVLGYVRDYLRRERLLDLKEEATRIAPVSEGVPFLGLRIWADHWRLQRSRFWRTRRTLERHYAAHVRGDVDGWKLQEIGRAMDGAIRWYGFKGVFRGVGEKTLAQYGMTAADDGLPLWKGTGDKAAVDSGTARFIMGGSWNDGTTNGPARLGAGSRWGNATTNTNNNVGFRLFSPERREGNTAMYPSTEPSRATCASQCGGDEHAPGDIGASSLRASAGHRPVSPSFGNVECRMENVECGMENVECEMENGEFNK